MTRPKTITDDEILAVARRVFRARGHAASTREIGLEAGISEGVLYQRFGSKDDLFFASMAPSAPDLEALLGPEVPVGDAMTYINGVLLRLAGYFCEIIPVALHVMTHPSFDHAALGRAMAGAARLQEGLAKRLAWFESKKLLRENQQQNQPRDFWSVWPMTLRYRGQRAVPRSEPAIWSPWRPSFGAALRPLSEPLRRANDETPPGLLSQPAASMPVGQKRLWAQSEAAQVSNGIDEAWSSVDDARRPSGVLPLATRQFAGGGATDKSGDAMRPRLDHRVKVLACLVTACGGRSSLGDYGATNEAGGAFHGTSSGRTWVSTGSGTRINTGGAKTAEGGFIAYTGGAHAMGGSTGGLGRTWAAGTTFGGRASATGGVTHATGGASTTDRTFNGTGGALATGGATHGQGDTKATGGTSLGQGGTSVSSGGSSIQGGVSATGGTGVVTGGVTASGGVTATAAIVGGTAGSNSIAGCGVDQVLCGTGAAAKCVNPRTDPEHCGQCGHACAKDAACSSGACQLPRCQATFRIGGNPTIETASTATALAVGDLDGDGHLDFATANDTANTVSVLLGDGTGTFGQRIDYPTDNRPQGIAIVDFNRDNKLDLATANFDASSVSLLLGKGDGTFESAVQHPVGSGPVAIAIDDFNGDGTEDIATANSSADSVSILLGSGHGTFATRVDFPAGTAPNLIAVGDFNTDGKKDLITNGGSFAVVLLGAGNGTFTQAPIDSPDASGGRVGYWTLGDMNNDGKQDLIVARANGRRSPGTFGVLFGVGDGSFLPMVDYAPGWASVVASADLDGDGRLELVASVNNQSVEVFAVNANGSLDETVRYPTPAPPAQLVFGDFNGDTRLDIATLDRWGIYLLMATGNGKFDAPLSQPTSDSLYRLLLRDLNGDSQLDLAGIAAEFGATTSTINVELGLGNGTFAGSNDYSTNIGNGLIEAGDLNGDGHLDLVTANSSESAVRVLWNAGDASYPTQTDYPTATGTDFLALGDLDNDGKMDIVVTSVGSYSVSSSVTVLLNNGNGDFVANVYSYAAPWWTLALADLNHDGNLDLVQSNDEPDGLTVRLGLGDGRFGTSLQSFTNNANVYVNGTALGDLNGDGNLDLLSRGYSTTYLHVKLGVGDGTFTPLAPQSIAENYEPGRLALGDLNGDGILDLVSDGNISWVGFEIVALLGAGDGTFTCTTASLATGADGEFFALGDVNGDKRLDLVVPNADSKSINVLLNQPL